MHVFMKLCVYFESLHILFKYFFLKSNFQEWDIVDDYWVSITSNEEVLELMHPVSRKKDKCK